MSRPLEVQVSGTKVADGKTTYILYELLVKFDEVNSWTVKRRWSEAIAARNELIKYEPDLPALPKTWLPTANVDDDAFLEQRRLRISNFCRACIRHHLLVNHAAFLSFIGVVDPPVRGVLAPTPNLHLFRREFQNLADPLFGINEFIYDRKARCILTASQDVFLASRVDSFISNIRLPWEKVPTRRPRRVSQ